MKQKATSKNAVPTEVPVSEAAGLIGKSTKTVYKLVNEGVLESRQKSKRKMVISVASIKNYLKAMSDEVPVSEAARMLTSTPSTVMRLVRGGFLRAGKSTNGDAVVSVASIKAHLEAVRDHKFWDRDDNKERYDAAAFRKAKQ